MAKKSTKRTAIGAGLAAGAAAAAASYYFYFSKDAKKHRATAARWAGDLKKSAEREIGELKKIDKASVLAAIDKAAKMYQQTKSASKEDVLRAAKELKQHWQELTSELQKTRRSVAKTTKKRTAKKTPRKRS